MKRSGFLFWLTLNTIIGFAQTDSLLSVFRNQSVADSLRIDAAFQLAEYYIRHDNNEDSFKICTQLAQQLALNTPSEADDAKAYRFLGSHYTRVQQYDSAKINLDLAKKLFLVLNDSSSLAATYIGFSGYYERKQELTTATEMTLAAADIFEGLKDYTKLSVTYSNLALVFSKQEDFENCLKYRRLAYTYSHDAGPYYRSYFASQLASMFGELYMLDTTKTTYPDSLVKYANEGLDIAQRNNLPQAELKALGQLVAYHYTIAGNYELAMIFAKNLLIKAKKYNYPKFICEGYYKIADILIQMNNAEEAALYADSTLIAAAEADWDYYKMVAYERIYDANKKLGNFDIALAAYEKFKAFEDSLVNVEKTAAITELEKKYQTEKKEKEILDLQKEAALSEARIKQRNMLIIASVIFSLLLSIAGYLYYKQRMLANQYHLSNVQQRLLRAQINPHFFFNALSSIQTFFLKEQDGKKAVLYLSKFAKLMRLVLENSSEDFITVKEEISTLEGYLDLQKMRFHNAFEYSIHCDEKINAHEMAIPPMFAQPFIENALEHGLLPKDGNGKIDIYFVLNGDTITFTVEDNGVGIEKSAEIRRSKAKDHKSRATQITKDRLYLLNRGRQRNIEMSIIDIKNEADELIGTRVEIDLPFKVVS